MVTRGNGVGNVALFEDFPFDSAIINAQMLILRSNEKKLLSKYLYYLLTSKILQNQFKVFSSGSAQPQLPIKLLNHITISFPNIKEQLSISKILSDLDKKIDINQQMNQNLEEIGLEIFKQWFVKFEFPNEQYKPYKSSGGMMVDSELGEIPSGWKVGKLGDLIDITSGKRPGKKSDFIDDEFFIPLIGASSLMGFVKEILFDEPILVIGRVGTHGVVQRVLPPSFPSDNTLVLKTKFYEFIYQSLKRIDYDSLNVGTTQPLITQTSIKKYRIIIPSPLMLKNYEVTASKLFSKIEANNYENSYLSKIRDSLLPKLISGKIRINMEKQYVNEFK